MMDCRSIPKALPPEASRTGFFALLGLLPGCNWSDEAIIWEAIETIDPLRVTARIRPMVIVGVDGDGWLPVRDFSEIVQNEATPASSSILALTTT
jgi:hypothetical protein